MNEEMKVEVLMSPHMWDNPEFPYFWCVLLWSDYSSCWHNSGHMGWSKTPKDGFDAALQAYNELNKKSL